MHIAIDREDRSTRRFVVLAALLVALAFTGCKNDEDGSDEVQNFQGVFSDQGGGSGTLEISITAPPIVSRGIGGELHTAAFSIAVSGGSGVVEITGTFDPQTGLVLVDDLGWVFSGVVNGPQLAGSCESPGAVPGSFVALSSDSDNVTVYCGSFTGDANGLFNIAVGSSVAMLTATNTETGDSAVAAGTVAANAVSFEEDTLTVTGTLSGSSISGTWEDSAKKQSGTWSGTTAECE